MNLKQAELQCCHTHEIVLSPRACDIAMKLAVGVGLQTTICADVGGPAGVGGMILIFLEKFVHQNRLPLKFITASHFYVVVYLDLFSRLSHTRPSPLQPTFRAGGKSDTLALGHKMALSLLTLMLGIHRNNNTITDHEMSE